MPMPCAGKYSMGQEAHTFARTQTHACTHARILEQMHVSHTIHLITHTYTTPEYATACLKSYWFSNSFWGVSNAYTHTRTLIVFSNATTLSFDVLQLGLCVEPTPRTANSYVFSITKNPLAWSRVGSSRARGIGREHPQLYKLRRQPACSMALNEDWRCRCVRHCDALTCVNRQGLSGMSLCATIPKEGRQS